MSVLPPLPPSAATTARSVLDGFARQPGGGVFVTGSGTPYGAPPSSRTRHVSYDDQPPVGVVVGAGAVGALAGHLVFHSLLVSVGLGIGAMGLAASSEDKAGEIARSSGRMALAAFEKTTDLNDRYHLTDRVVEGVRTAGWKLKEFDKEHAVVHRATEGARAGWRNLKQYDDTHGLTARAGHALSSGFDRLAEALTPPPLHYPPDGPIQSRGGSGSRETSPARAHQEGGRWGGGGVDYVTAEERRGVRNEEVADKRGKDGGAGGYNPPAARDAAGTRHNRGNSRERRGSDMPSRRDGGVDRGYRLGEDGPGGWNR